MNVVDLETRRIRKQRKEAERLVSALRAAISDYLRQLVIKAEKPRK